MKAISSVYLVAGGVVLAALAYVAFQGPKQTGQQIGAWGVDLADGVITGAVTAVGERVGVPKTDMTECERAKADGRTWDASFVCPAGDFLGYVWN
jgi:hypothetical protein